MQPATEYDLRPVTVVPTNDAAIVETFKEVARLRPDAIPIVDGDNAGATYLTGLFAANPTPSKVIRYGDNAAVEQLSAWILEPALAAPGDVLASLLPGSNDRTIKNLRRVIIEKKKDRDLREKLAWEALDSIIRQVGGL